MKRIMLRDLQIALLWYLGYRNAPQNTSQLREFCPARKECMGNSLRRMRGHGFVVNTNIIGPGVMLEWTITKKGERELERRGILQAQAMVTAQGYRDKRSHPDITTYPGKLGVRILRALQEGARSARDIPSNARKANIYSAMNRLEERGLIHLDDKGYPVALDYMWSITHAGMKACLLHAISKEEGEALGMLDKWALTREMVGVDEQTWESLRRRGFIEQITSGAHRITHAGRVAACRPR